MNRHLNFVTLICLITGFVSLASCSNDDDEMNKYQKIYIRTGVAPGAEMSAVVVVDRVSNSSTADRSDFEIQLCAVQPVSREVTATLGIDTLKVNAYNSAKKTKCELLPGDNYDIDKKESTLKTGQTVAESSFRVVLKNIEKLSNPDGYVLPVMLKEVTGMDGQAVSTSMNTVYIRIYASILYTGYTKPADWAAVDRSAWDVSCSNAYANDDARYGAHLAIDGEANTSWFSWGVANAEECWWNTVLSRPVTLAGFSVTKQSAYGSSYNLKSAEIKVRKDGATEWVTYQRTLTFRSFKGNEPQYAVIEPPIGDVKEFRINCLSPDSYTGFAEINLFVKQ